MILEIKHERFNEVTNGHVFATFDESWLDDETSPDHRWNKARVRVSRQQAEALCEWLTEELYGVSIKKAKP